ncbi:hypothetical protein SDC9_155027 [bioreactor metagenome]|uniref:Uncharacterized protein n=1 Tax=bioreactor metagenome TaxID=1076179 RepID=A0A645F0C4_9ZZZZ
MSFLSHIFFQSSSVLPYSSAGGRPVSARIFRPFAKLSGRTSQIAFISTPSIKHSLRSDEGPLFPNPIKPIRTVSKGGAAYPHMLKCCFLDFRTSFKVLRNFTSSFFDLLHEIMLGLITTPAVRVPADFKKVLLLVFIVVNNQD